MLKNNEHGYGYTLGMGTGMGMDMDTEHCHLYGHVLSYLAQDIFSNIRVSEISKKFYPGSK
jgi:hypothetical protein